MALPARVGRLAQALAPGLLILLVGGPALAQKPPCFAWSADSACIPQVVVVNPPGSPGATGAPLGSVSVSNFPATQTTASATASVTATPSALTADTDLQVLAANTTRKGLEVYIQPTTCAMNIAFGAAAVVGTGLTYGLNGVVGYGQSWTSGVVPSNSIHVITHQAGCTAIVREYN